MIAWVSYLIGNTNIGPFCKIKTLLTFINNLTGNIGNEPWDIKVTPEAL